MFISKWESEINIDINFDNVFLICSLVTNNFKLKNFNLSYFIKCCQHKYLVKLGQKMLISVVFVNVSQTQFYITLLVI